jgi:regulatory protein
MVTKEEKTLYSACCQYALKYISRYPKTEKELRIKLQQKWYNSDEIRYTMDYLKSKNFVDDSLFAESYVRSELVNKWKPVIIIRNKLYKKWVDKSLINEIINEYEEDILVGIFQKIKKEIDNYKKKEVDWFDIIQKLMRKGYRLDDIKEVIKNW